MDAMLTTTDNPYNPFTQFIEWNAFDEAAGYYTCNYLARVAHVSESLSNEEYNTEINNAIDEIVKINVLGIYIKVTEDSLISAVA